jgi:hypothetical protein
LDAVATEDESTKELKTLNQGFLAVAQIGSSNADAAARLKMILDSLRKDNSDDAKSYTSQLETSLRLFTPKAQS